MRIADLQTRLPLASARLAGPQRLYRVQLAKARPTSVVIGSVILAPTGTLSCRYDLTASPVAYFSFDDATAIYETFARRDATSIPLATLGLRALLTVSFSATGLRIADLRPHTSDWPALQSTRYSSTQDLAHDLAGQRFDGVLYASAQHYGKDSLALFGKTVIAAVSFVRSEQLFDVATKRLHLCTMDAARGSELQIV